MTLSMFEASVPVFTRMLDNLANILRKGQADLTTRKIDEAVIMNARLAPDMLPFTRQIQIACDMAVRGTSKLAGVEPPAMPDTEASFAELLARIERSVQFVQTMGAGSIDGTEQRAITLKVPSMTLDFTGQTYLLNFVLPNLYFHVTTAYLILRHNGVALGKTDFVGNP